MPTVAPLHEMGQGQTTLASYLGLRLRHIGVDHLFGLPGDFNLALVDEMLSGSGLCWVGTTNELNGAYAADGYARLRGFGAVLTTFGVGELSAVNAIAGSFAESVPVLQITGAPATDVMQAGVLAHHTLGDGDFGHFHRAYTEVTVASEVLTRQAPADQIDRVLTAMLAESRPGYLSVPSDLVSWPVPAAGLETPLRPPASDPVALAHFREAAARHLAGATDVALLSGHLVRRRGLQHLLDFGRVPGVTIATTLGGVASGPTNVYIGALTPDTATRVAVEGSAIPVLAGVVFSDITSGMFSHHIDLGRAVVLELDRAHVGSTGFEGVQLADTLAVIADLMVLRGSPGSGCGGCAPAVGAPPEPVHLTVPASGDMALAVAETAQEQDRNGAPPRRCLAQSDLWSTLETWIRPGTTVLADAGTAYYGAVGMHLAAHCELVGQPIWSSIGYTLPALLGTELADPGHRPLLLIGDGAAQLTIQELATILHRRLDVVIFVLDNGGYTIERKIGSPDAVYQDITAWNWTALPGALGMADDADTAVVGSVEDLLAALAAIDSPDRPPRPALVEVRLHRDDAPDLLQHIARGLHRDPPVGPATELPRSA
jgi:TPP-dependent 2-oxoacid decarboxylase